MTAAKATKSRGKSSVQSRASRAGKSTPAKPQKPATPAAEVSSISVSKIDSPGFNPREDFDEKQLADLAKSIESVGLLEPVVVRPKGRRFELVCGERRLRAVKLLGWAEITCSVRKLSDKQAAECQLIENVDRRSLNAIEEASAFRQLKDLGHDETTLAALLRINESAINGRLGLLELPDEWQERVRSGKLTPAAGEYLTAWAQHPAILEAMKPVSNRWPMPLVTWRQQLVQIVLSLSRAMEPTDPDGPQFNGTAEDLARLEIVDLELSPGRLVRRAMNAALWDTWQDAAQKYAAEEAKKNGRPGATAAPATGRLSETQRNSHKPAARPSETSDQCTADFEAALTAWTQAWLKRLIVDRLDELSVTAIAELAEALHVDLAAEWKLTRMFLQLHSGERLEQLAEELQIDLSACENRSEMIAVMLHVAPGQTPQSIVELIADTLPA